MTTPSSPKASFAARSFRDWAQAQSLHEALGRAEAAVRARPEEAQARWLLFELLCVLGQWERALKQLQTWSLLSKEFDGTAQVMRGLIRAEHQRMEVFEGRAQPATLAAAEAPAWMATLGEALAREAEGAIEAGDQLREAALAQASDAPGASNLLARFGWLADADSRLGPVCEVVLAGAYRWLAFTDLRSLRKTAPRSLLDLVWSQADLVLRDGTPVKGYMPMRYPVRAGDRDALLMARETVWSELGRTGVHGRGQKMWMSDAGDMALLDLRACEFGADAADAAARLAQTAAGGQGDAID